MPPATPSKAGASCKKRRGRPPKTASRKRGPRGPRTAKAPKKPKIILSDWICRRCQLTNRASATICFKCTASREESEITSAVKGPVLSVGSAGAAVNGQEVKRRKLGLSASPAFGKAAQQARKPCPECVIGFVVVRTGAYGRFAACTGFPKCSYKGKLDQQESPAPAQKQQSSPAQPPAQSIDRYAISCKHCKGDLVEYGIGKDQKFRCRDFPVCPYMISFETWKRLRRARRLQEQWKTKNGARHVGAVPKKASESKPKDATALTQTPPSRGRKLSSSLSRDRSWGHKASSLASLVSPPRLQNLASCRGKSSPVSAGALTPVVSPQLQRPVPAGLGILGLGQQELRKEHERIQQSVKATLMARLQARNQ